MISDDDDKKGVNKEQDKLDDELTVRALKRKQERIDAHNEEKKMNEREKKKAKDAIKLIDEFEAKQKAEDKKKRDEAEEKARNERVEKVTKKG